MDSVSTALQTNGAFQSAVATPHGSPFHRGAHRTHNTHAAAHKGIVLTRPERHSVQVHRRMSVLLAPPCLILPCNRSCYSPTTQRLRADRREMAAISNISSRSGAMSKSTRIIIGSVPGNSAGSTTVFSPITGTPPTNNALKSLTGGNTWTGTHEDLLQVPFNPVADSTGPDIGGTIGHTMLTVLPSKSGTLSVASILRRRIERAAAATASCHSQQDTEERLDSLSKRQRTEFPIVLANVDPPGPPYAQNNSNMRGTTGIGHEGTSAFIQRNIGQNIPLPTFEQEADTF